MGVCLRSPIYIYLYHNMTKNTTGVISRFLCTSIQLCRVRTWMWKSWTAGWGWQAIGLPPKSCPLPLLASLLPFLLSSCPPPWHTCPRSGTTRWWWTPARRSASLRRLSRATLSLLNTRYILPELDLTCLPSACSHLSQVLDGGDEMTSELDINFKLLSPRGHPLVAEFKKSDGTHSHHIEVSNGRW